MGVQVYKHIASVLKIPFRLYMEQLLGQHGCGYSFHTWQSRSYMLLCGCLSDTMVLRIWQGTCPLGKLFSVFPVPQRSAPKMQRSMALQGQVADCSLGAVCRLGGSLLEAICRAGKGVRINTVMVRVLSCQLRFDISSHPA